MTDFGFTIFIPLIPLVMFLVLGLSSGTMKKEVSGYLGTLGMLVTTFLSYFTAFQYFFNRQAGIETFEKIIPFNTVWLHLTRNCKSI